ncbi:MAG: C1 family peptidase, partial [Trueperaceae bacterium]
MAKSVARHHERFLAVLVGTVLIAGCGGPSGPTEPTYTKDYVIVDGQPKVILSDGSVFALQREDEWQELIDQFPADEIEQSTSRLEPLQLPPSVDLRANQTAIRNQGGRNTCVAFATVAGIEAAYQRLAGMTLDLSEQYANHIQKATALPQTMVELPARETQLGAWGGSGVAYQLGWLYRLRFGLPLETDLAYVPQGNYEDTDQPGDVPRLLWSDPTVTQQEVDQWNLEKDAVAYNIPEPLTLTNLPRQALAAATYGVSAVSPVTPINLANLKQALADGREVVFSVILTKPAEGDTEYVDGVWFPTSDDWGGHAMVMVGYDDATSSFLVKNSWGLETGTGRGQPAAADLDADGFIRMSYSWVPKIREALTVTAVRD